MKSLNAAKHPEIGKTSYGTIKTLESLPNNTNTIVTSDISLFPGLWEIELQLNGFESTGSKWILIQAVPYGTIAIVNGMNLYGERLTVPYLSNYGRCLRISSESNVPSASPVVSPGGG